MKETAFKISLALLLIAGMVLTMLYSKKHVETPTDSDCCYMDSTEYQFIVTEDSVTVYNNNRTVGTIKLEGALDSLINNQ